MTCIWVASIVHQKGASHGRRELSHKFGMYSMTDTHTGYASWLADFRIAW